ncbi:hypothetical protein C4580_06380 [Candidatus Woesearchaeota archaeon]|nr:MAG: hypothetical protein C4580_06380 [Candidatus Woesearchaeota archaeon]
MVMNWNSCLRNKEAKKITPDTEMAASLEKTSANKALSAHLLELRAETAASKISLSYDSVRELLEAITLRQGFKIYNHVCYTAFLKEIIKDTDLADAFDQLRQIRNDINYYGKDVSLTEAQEILQRLKKLRENTLPLLQE